VRHSAGTARGCGRRLYDLFTTFKAPQITRIIIIIIIIIILKNEYHSNIIVDRLQGCGAVYLQLYCVCLNIFIMLAYLALLNRRQEKARDVQNTSFQQPAKFIVQGLCDIWAKVW